MLRKNKIITKRLAAGLLAIILAFTSMDLSANADESIAVDEISYQSDISENDSDTDLIDVSENEQEEDEEEILGEDTREENVDDDDNGIPSSYNTELDDFELPATRYQGEWNSCWAHAAIALAEASMIAKNNADTSVDLSELALAYFTYNSVTDPLGGTEGDNNHILVQLKETEGLSKDEMNYLSRGGEVYFAWRTLAAWCGLTADSGSAAYCKGDTTVESLPSEYAYDNKAAELVQVRFYKATDSDLIKEEIMMKGAVAASYYENSAYYNETFNSYNYTGNNKTNHYITIVGWDDSFSRNNFNSPASSDGAWLIRNSWATNSDFCHSAYFWMSYEDASLVGSNFVSYEFVSKDTYDNNYQYDGGAATTSSGVNRVANVFTVNGEKGCSYEKLTAVSFSVASTDNLSAAFSNVPYTIQVFTNVEEGRPTSGQLQCTVTGTTTQPGYYTVMLPDQINMASGTKFSVVIETSGNKYVDIEKSYDWSFTGGEVGIKGGQSYGLVNGAWEDFSAYTPANVSISEDETIGNICIKAFTVDVPDDLSGKCKIIFDGNTNTSGSMNKLIVSSSDTGKLTANAFVKSGYTFTGWNTQRNGSGTAYADRENLSSVIVEGKAVRLYAQWKPAGYVYHFVFNKSGLKNVDLTVSYDEKVNLYEIYKLVSGKYFDVPKWRDSANNEYKGTISWPFGESVHEATLYADSIWCSLYFSTNEDLYYWVPIVEYGALLNENDYILNEPIKEGYIFAGWAYKDGTLFDVSTPITSDIYLSATWKTAENYTVTFDANGGKINEKASDDVPVVGGNPVGRPIDPVREGYTFVRWVTSAGKEYNFAYTVKNDMTLTAEWKAKEYTVSFQLVGGNPLAVSTKTVYYDQKFGALFVPTKKNCVFDGWYDEDTGEKITADTVCKLTDDITLYAHWSRRIVTVKFDGGDHSTQTFSPVYMYAGSKFDKKIVDEEEVDFSFPTVTSIDEGYSFVGWVDRIDNEVTAESTVPDAETITITATYEGIICKVTIDYQGGFVNNSSYTEFTVKYGDKINPEIPQKAGCTFARWESDTGTFNTETDVIKGDTALGAVWDSKYKVSTPTMVNTSPVYATESLYLTTKTPDADIYYRIGSSDLINSSKAVREECSRYTDGIVFENPGTYSIFAIAVKNGYENSEILVLNISVSAKPADWGDITGLDRLIFGDISNVTQSIWLSGDTFETTPVYNAKAYTYSSLKVYFGTKLLVEGKDYSKKYTNNTNAGTAKLTITGKGPFKGTYTHSFTIEKASIDSASVIKLNKVDTMPWSSKKGGALHSILLEDTITGKTLKKGTDYTVSYLDAEGKTISSKMVLGEGTVVTVKVTGIKNYAGEFSYSYTVVNKKLSSLASAKVTVPALTYTGEALELTGTVVTPVVGEILVKDAGGKVLTEGKDYELVGYKNNKNAGTATVTIRAIESDESACFGSKTITYKINKRSISAADMNLWMTGDSGKTGWGEGNLPQITYYPGIKNVSAGITRGETELLPGTDFKVSFKNANKIGKSRATITFEGKGNYTGKITKKYDIVARALSNTNNLTSESEYYGSSTKDYALNPKVVCDGTVLKKGTDYTVVYSLSDGSAVKNLANGTTICMKISGKGNYTTSAPIEHSYTWFTKIAVSTTDIQAEESVIFDANGAKPAVSIKYNNVPLTENVDYVLSYKNNKKVAAKKEGNSKAPYIQITGKGKFAGTKKVYFAIERKNIEGFTLTAANVPYSNKAGKYKSAPVVKDTNGKVLKNGTDYKIVGYYYAADIRIGSSIKLEGTEVGTKDIPPSGALIRIVVEGKGNYCGTLGSASGSGSMYVEYTYKITYGSLSGAKVKAIPNKYYTGYEIKPGKDELNITVNGTPIFPEDYDIVYSNNINKGTAKITIIGKGSYCGTKTVTFKIVERKIQ